MFTADGEETRDTYRVTVRQREVGTRPADSTYKMAVLSCDGGTDDAEETIPAQPTEATPQPPVAEGETRAVEIEDVSDQEDGVARVDRGFVVIVPDTEVSEQPRIRIQRCRGDRRVRGGHQVAEILRLTREKGVLRAHVGAVDDHRHPRSPVPVAASDPTLAERIAKIKIFTRGFQLQ